MKNIREFFWPLLDRKAPTDITKLTSEQIYIKDENIEKALEFCIKIYESELTRSSSIENKSSIFIGTLAIITSVVLSITTMLVNQNNFSNVLFGLIITLFFLVIYVLRTIWFAIKVLERKGFHTLYYDDILINEDKNTYYKTIIVGLIDKINRNSLIINTKVDFMVMAQEYFKRAVITLSIYSVLIVVFFIEKSKLEIQNTFKNFIKILNGTEFNTGFILITVSIALISLIINWILLKKLK